ncbi:hypothetical protein UlMin_009557 [Ulmus minor]
MEEQRLPLEIKVISAKDLKDVNLMTKMDVYAVVSISGDSRKQKTKTTIDRGGGTNPTWNFPVKFTVDEASAKQNRLTVVFKLVCDRNLGDKDVGQVIVPVKELLDSAGDGKSFKFVSYQVRKPSGKPKGELHFSYKFGDQVVGEAAAPTINKANDPVNAYPATTVAVEPSAPLRPRLYPSLSREYATPPPPVAGYGGYPPPPYGGYPPQPPHSAYPPQPSHGGYPPQPLGYGYPPPPPAPPGYGYPPAPGYGYPPPPVEQQPKKNNRFGMGLGAGLVGGMLGGLLIGDVVSDAAAYDSGYDAGFGDMGGF